MPVHLLKRPRLAHNLPTVTDNVDDAPRHYAPGNVHRYVDPLTEAGVSTEFTDRSRDRAWRAPEVLGALDAFVERAGHRGLL